MDRRSWLRSACRRMRHQLTLQTISASLSLIFFCRQDCHSARHTSADSLDLKNKCFNLDFQIAPLPTPCPCIHHPPPVPFPHTSQSTIPGPAQTDSTTSQRLLHSPEDTLPYSNYFPPPPRHHSLPLLRHHLHSQSLLPAHPTHQLPRPPQTPRRLRTHHRAPQRHRPRDRSAESSRDYRLETCGCLMVGLSGYGEMVWGEVPLCAQSLKFS